MPQLEPKVYCLSECGDRPDNQDHVAHCFLGDHWVGVVADGAGGYEGGQEASALVVNALLHLFDQSPTTDPAALRRMLEQANERIRQAQQQHSDYANMRTTVCMTVIDLRSRSAVWLHVGDSRIYHLRDETCLSQSKDHSVLQWMCDHAPNQEKPSRNALYTAMGECPTNLAIEVLAEPRQLQSGDWLMMCTDGLWEYLSGEEFAQVGAGLHDQDMLLSHLHALATQRGRGRCDNMTSLAFMVP